MTPLEIVEGARLLLTDPTKWTKGYSARTHKNAYVGSLHPAAICFCTLGALEKTCGKTDGPELFQAINMIRENLPEWSGNYVSDFNDALDTNHEDVLALLDRTLEANRGA